MYSFTRHFFACEHDCFESMSNFSFQRSLFSKCCVDMRVGAFGRFMLPTHGKNTELVSNTPKIFFREWKVGELQIFEAPKSQMKYFSLLKHYVTCHERIDNQELQGSLPRLTH
eukprot:UN22508